MQFYFRRLPVAALEPPFAANITAKCYDGGHMMYDEPEIRRQVANDVAAFYKRALAASPPRSASEPTS